VPKVLANEFAVPAAGKEAEPHRQLLNHVENGDQTQQQRQQPIAPSCPALRGRNDIASIGIGQHRPDVSNEQQKRSRPWYRLDTVLQAVFAPPNKVLGRRFDLDEAVFDRLLSSH
jgi:hypothetical protein